LVQLGTKDGEFPKYQQSTTHILLRCANEFLSLLSTFIIWFRWNWV